MARTVDVHLKVLKVEISLSNSGERVVAEVRYEDAEGRKPYLKILTGSFVGQTIIPKTHKYRIVKFLEVNGVAFGN